MTAHYDARETADPDRREARLLAALPAQIAHARSAPRYARLLAGVDPGAVADRAALARLPVTRKSDLPAWQAEEPPFGGLVPPGTRLRRVFASPGPILDPEGDGDDWWRFARALYAAGIRAGDTVHNGFAYHLTPAGAMIETGAAALGATVIPGGTGQTEQQLEVIAALRPTAYAGTPSFLRILLEKGREAGRDLSSLTRALVSGEALPPSLRDELAGHGVAVLQCYGTADLGLVAYESPAREGMILDEGVLLEIVRPGTGDPVGAGEVGEVVVTSFNAAYPLLRFATGDLSAVLPGPSPCGRTNTRIRGWMGRADQTTKVRGMFVHPAQVAEAAKRHPELGRVRLVVEGEAGRDAMTLHAETATPEAAGLAEAVAASLAAATKLRGAVVLVVPGTLANDGKVIEDRRDYR